MSMIRVMILRAFEITSPPRFNTPVRKYEPGDVATFPNLVAQKLFEWKDVRPVGSTAFDPLLERPNNDPIH